MAEERDEHERGYEEGYKAANVALLRTALQNLGADSPEANAERWKVERAEAIAMLRRVCEDFGDNDWPDNLYLPDIIDKHLYRYLDEESDA
jgi:post-segregation antitoxin (ccd killing protein)